jgi:PIN domain nuclease of toxin-antitoxin system
VNLLLDTHVFLWWDRADRALNADARALIADTNNQVFVSAASIWEIGIKRRLGKLEFRGAAVAAIGANDAEAAGALAWQHNDPFDRMLVAQARRLTFTLATADAAIREYTHVAQTWAG